MTSLGGAPFENAGAWDAVTDDAGFDPLNLCLCLPGFVLTQCIALPAIGGADYGKPLDESLYANIKSEECDRRKHHCDWTVVGPVAANGQRWSFK
eukprot:1714196-Rhodomonas_salina.4